MPNIDPDLPQARQAPRDLAREPASLFRRALATAIDLVFATLIGLCARGLERASWLELSSLSQWILERPRLAWSLSVALPAWIGLSALEALPGCAGPGKRLLGLCLEGPRAGQLPSFARVALRTAIKFAPFYIAALALLFPEVWDPQKTLERSRLLTLLGSNLWLGIYLAAAAMTRRRQSLHDLATGTAVRHAVRATRTER